MKYRVIKDYKIIPEGTILERDINGKYPFTKEDGDILISTSLEEEVLKDADYFEPLFKINISEKDIDNTHVKNWKVVFNIKCTERELIDVENIIRENLNKYV